MRPSRIGLLTALVWIAVATAGLMAQPLEYTPTGIKHQPSTPAQKSLPGGEEKPFKELIKDRVAIPGLFTFYRDTLTNTMFMSIKPSQLDKIYLMGETVSKAEGAFFDNGSMGETSPVYFKKVGKKIMFMEKNLRLRADSSSALSKAVASGLSDHLIVSVKIESKPDDSTKAILIDPANLFIRDADNVGYFLGTRAQLGIMLDRDNSYFGTVKSFPENSEIDVQLSYRTSKPVDAPTMQNPYSFFHTYHYSLTNLPESDYVPENRR